MVVCIREGFLEGSLTSRGLRTALKKHGYSLTTDAAKADIIIAHSSGWLFLPPLRDEQRLILVDPSYKTGESSLLRALKRARYDITHFTPRMIPQRILNILYFSKLKTWIQLRREYNIETIDHYFARKNTTVCRVADPTWWSDTKLYNSPAEIVYIGGDHDAFWRNPEEFIYKVDLA